MTGKSETAAEVRVLGGGDSTRGRRETHPPHFDGVLSQIRGTRLIVRTTLPASAIRCGALVEVETTDRIYLGEIKHYSEGDVFIDFEHQLDKGTLRTIRDAWS